MTEFSQKNFKTLCTSNKKMSYALIFLNCVKIFNHNWRAPWKNRISSTSVKLRKSLVMPVEMRQNIYRVVRFFHPRSSWTMHLMLFSERPPTWWSQMKEPNNSIYFAASLALWVIFVRRKRPQIYASGITISGDRTEQHVVIGFGELVAVD